MADAGDLSTKPKLSKAKTVVAIVLIAAFCCLVAVIKLNQIFHWWLTPPWQ